MKRKKEQVKIPFIITIDTEGDNLWSKPSRISTTNVDGLYRFQELCNKFGFKPVYLTNYEMVSDKKYVLFAKKYLEKGQCEIGMHLHAWNNPPIIPLTTDDYYYQPFLMEYDKSVIEEKIKFLSDLLRKTFSQDIVSHRAGRWAMNSTYVNALIKNGFKIDCSFTPGINWKKFTGDPNGSGGTNYYRSKSIAHIIKKEVSGELLEVPMTVFYRLRKGTKVFNSRPHLPYFIYRILFKPMMLRPSKSNLDVLKKAIQIRYNHGAKYLEFMIHSSELTYTTNQTFCTENDIENLYRDLESLFEFVSHIAFGCTLKEYYEIFNKR